MSDHYVAINRGKEGFVVTDFTVGASSTSGADLELRIADAAGFTRKDIGNAMDALKRYVLDFGLKNLPVGPV